MSCSLNIVVALLLSCIATIFSCGIQKIVSPEDTVPENMKKLAMANNELSLNLLRQLTVNKTGNVLLSPLGLSSVFSMLYYGTKGDIAKELRAALGYDKAELQEESVHQTFHQYLTQYLPSQDNSSYVLSLANAALLDKSLNLIPSYKNEVQDLYQALVQDADFVTEGPRLVDDINNWVREKTNGKIENLLDDLDQSTTFLLLNAVYFKGAWDAPFDTRLTSTRTFYNNGVETGTKEVHVMRRRHYFPYAALDDFKALELAYKGKTVSMMILLPNERDGLLSMEKNLTPEKLSEARRQLRLRKVYAVIPKFKIEYFEEMSEDFKSIGAKRVFTSAADFSGIASRQNVSLNKVFHLAELEVNEKGGEGIVAPLHGFGKRSSSRYHRFIADHPFLYAIVDKRNDMILFLGHVTNL